MKYHPSNPLRSQTFAVAPLLGILLISLAAHPVEAASSLTNSLTGYTGTSQDNYPAQPGFLAGSGLDVTFVWGGGAGAWEKIGFDSSGAAFGYFHGGSDGRNYLRTLDNNYAPVSFSAYVTVNRATRQSVFFGMGTGDLGSYKAPDAGSGNASVFLELQDGYDNGARHVLGGTPGAPSNVEVGYNAMTNVTGLMRLRMDYNAVAKTVVYSIDYNPSGAFVADQTFPAVDVSSIAPEWTAGEKSSIYFGGQGNMIFSNFVVVASLPVGGLDHFEVSASSSPTAGAAFNVTITAQDISNATVNDSSTLVVVNSPTGGSLMEFDWNSDGTYGDNSGTLVAGVKTIKARNKKAETVSIQAFGGLGTTTYPPDVTTTADVFSKLQLLAPGEAAAPGTATGKRGAIRGQVVNHPFDVTVNAVDAYGNLVNGVYDTVGITSTDGTATLPADDGLVDGTRTFAVTLNTNGNFTLTASDLSVGGITPSTVAVKAYPVLATAGTWKSFTITSNQTPSAGDWTVVPVASQIIPKGTATAKWDIKHIRACNDATNLYLLVELWPGSTVNLRGGIENLFWIDNDNDPATGLVDADGTGVGAEQVLENWQVWRSEVKQVLSSGMTANVSPNASVVAPFWPADNGLYYQYSISLAATNTDGSAVFPTNTVTIGLGSRLNGTLQTMVPAFRYTLATHSTSKGATFRNIAIDGTFNDWAGIPAAAMLPEGTDTNGWDIKQLSIANDESYFYFLVELWPSSTNADMGAYTHDFNFHGSTNVNAGFSWMHPFGSFKCEMQADFGGGWGQWIDYRTGGWVPITGTGWPTHIFAAPTGSLTANVDTNQNYKVEIRVPRSATYTDGSPVFSSDTFTLGYHTRSPSSGKIGVVTYRVAPAPGNPVAMQISGGSFSFSVTNSSGSYVVQASTNLANPAGWTPISTNPAPFTFTDPTPVRARPARFYRTVVQ